MKWLHAVRHVARETLLGLQGGLTDIRYVRTVEKNQFTPEEEEFLTRAGMPMGDVDQFALARRMRHAQDEAERAEDAAEQWLAETAKWLPGLRELSRVGDRRLDEFRDWMTRDHAWLPEDGMWPQGVWNTERELIERKWREHVRGVDEGGW